MLSFGSIFGDDVKRKYLSAQNFRLHFLFMIFEAGSLHLSNCILVLGYGEPSTCSYRLRSSRTTPAANTGWLTGQRGAQGVLVSRLVLDWISHAGWSSLFSFRDHTYLLRLTCDFTWELNYTQFLTFESTRNSPALQLLGSHYPRDPKKLQSAKCPSNVVRTKFPTCLHKALDWILLDSWVLD
jgi:hypothetical protein